jgi:hypothetical protein
MKLVIGSGRRCSRSCCDRPGSRTPGCFSAGCRRRGRRRSPLLGAAALERVIEAHPVADLVGAGVAEVVRRRGAAGHRRVQDDHAVDLGLRRVARRERRPAEQAAAHVVRVDVEVVRAALTQRVLHLRLAGATGAGVPGGVGGAVGHPSEGERPAGRRVGRVEHVDLRGDLRVGDVAVRQRRAVVDDVPVDRDGAAGDVRDDVVLVRGEVGSISARSATSRSAVAHRRLSDSAHPARCSPSSTGPLSSMVS